MPISSEVVALLELVVPENSLPVMSLDYLAEGYTFNIDAQHT